MGRIEVIWRETTSHLLETCSHPHNKVVFSGFRIRIHFLRIRIQIRILGFEIHADPDPDPGHDFPKNLCVFT